MRKHAYVPDIIQGIRDELKRADEQRSTVGSIDHILIAVDRLLDLTEKLAQRIVDLERVQNERAE